MSVVFLSFTVLCSIFVLCVIKPFSFDHSKGRNIFPQLELCIHLFLVKHKLAAIIFVSP